MPNDYALAPEERETCMLYNERDKTASLITFNGALIRRLNKLCETNPDFKLVRTYDCGRYTEYEYEILKRYVAVRAPKTLTDEQRAKISERMIHLRGSKKWVDFAFESNANTLFSRTDGQGGI